MLHPCFTILGFVIEVQKQKNTIIGLSILAHLHVPAFLGANRIYKNLLLGLGEVAEHLSLGRSLRGFLTGHAIKPGAPTKSKEPVTSLVL